MNAPGGPAAAFLDAAVWHGSLEESRGILSSHPEIARHDIFAAAVLGDAEAVAGFIAADPTSAVNAGGPRGWPPLLYLCLSKYLRLEPSRSEGFLAAAVALLDAGADPNGGVVINGENETPLYGAAGVAQHEGLTRLLVTRGADPNDVEVAYHSPETHDNAAMQVLLDTGRMTASNLAMMLVRKADYHDLAGMALLLRYGANADGDDSRPWRPLHHAIRRDNQLDLIALLLEHGADPHRTDRTSQMSAVSLAVRRGRADVLALLESRGVTIDVVGVERLIKACATDDRPLLQALMRDEPGLVATLRNDGAALLGAFASSGNAKGIGNLLDAGVPIDVRWSGDGYHEIPPQSTALHVAAWRGRSDIVGLLVSRGADVHAVDGRGRTPLALAVRACVDSYWTVRRSPDSVRLLLEAGADVKGTAYPSGYDAVDALLRAHGATPPMDPGSAGR